MSKSIVVRLVGLSKVYRIYERKIDRLKDIIGFFGKKRGRDFYALKNINLEVLKGETLGIIGHNGAGKSTLLKILSGVLTPSHGEAVVNGRVASLLELGAGFNPDYTGFENVILQGLLMGHSEDIMRERMQEILQFADIGDFAGQPVRSYSSGMFARLAFAVAINVDPDVLIVDEALSVGDADFQLKCFSKMKSLRDAGVTILYVSHDVYSIRTFCSRCVWLEGGRVVAEGDPKDVISRYRTASVGKENVIVTQDNYTHPDLSLEVLSAGSRNLSIFSGEGFSISAKVRNNSLSSYNVSLVYNIYRIPDGLYISGATTLMDAVGEISLEAGGELGFRLSFLKVDLLAGRYRVRIAVNDVVGMGIMCDEKEAVFLTVLDAHEAEGMINLARVWEFGNV